MKEIFDLGPVQANVTQQKLDSLANNLIWVRTSQSSLASFAMGIPGGLAMAATVPADVLQFFGMSLRLAQELSYLYGGGIYDRMDKLIMKESGMNFYYIAV